MQSITGYGKPIQKKSTTFKHSPITGKETHKSWTESHVHRSGKLRTKLSNWNAVKPVEVAYKMGVFNGPINAIKQINWWRRKVECFAIYGVRKIWEICIHFKLSIHFVFIKFFNEWMNYIIEKVYVLIILKFHSQFLDVLSFAPSQMFRYVFSTRKLFNSFKILLLFVIIFRNQNFTDNLTRWGYLKYMFRIFQIILLNLSKDNSICSKTYHFASPDSKNPRYWMVRREKRKESAEPSGNGYRCDLFISYQWE